MFGDVARFDDMRGDGDGWSHVRGRYGFGSCNEAGENFLSFCAIHDLSIMSCLKHSPTSGGSPMLCIGCRAVTS